MQADVGLSGPAHFSTIVKGWVLRNESVVARIKALLSRIKEVDGFYGLGFRTEVMEVMGVLGFKTDQIKEDSGTALCESAGVC